MNQVIIAFGSNLANPIQQIQNAIAQLTALPEIQDCRVSSLYRTAPVGYADQPDFINAVAMLHTPCTAPELLKLLQKIENAFGRVRTFQNAPRTLDLDIVDFNHEKWDTAELTLPHPRAHQRGFVMLPLAEIAPDYVLGEHGCAAQIAANLPDDGIARLS